MAICGTPFFGIKDTRMTKSVPISLRTFMIDFQTNSLQVPGHLVEPIKDWRVWFVTCEGTFETLPEALASCAKTGEPIFNIRPVPVACGPTTFEIKI
jgi:hypothetical protein